MLNKSQLVAALPTLNAEQLEAFFENTDGYVLSLAAPGAGSGNSVAVLLSSLKNLDYEDYVWVENNIDKSLARIAAERTGNRPCPPA